MEDGQIF